MTDTASVFRPSLINTDFSINQSIDHYITYSVISSQPALSYTSVVSTIRAYPVTSGQHEGQTFVTWSGNFSSDADAGRNFQYLPRNFANVTIQVSLRMPSSSAARLLPTSPRLPPRSKVWDM